MIITDIIGKIALKAVKVLNTEFSVPLWIIVLQVVCAICMVGAHRYSNNKRIDEIAIIREQEKAIKFKEFYITNFINVTNRLSGDYSLNQKDVTILSNSIMWGKYD